MAELIKCTKSVCKRCMYSVVFSGESMSCDYIGATNESRCFVKNGEGKRRIPQGYCDKFEPKQKRRKTIQKFNNLKKL